MSDESLLNFSILSAVSKNDSTIFPHVFHMKRENLQQQQEHNCFLFDPVGSLPSILGPIPCHKSNMGDKDARCNCLKNEKKGLKSIQFIFYKKFPISRTGWRSRKLHHFFASMSCFDHLGKWWEIRRRIINDVLVSVCHLFLVKSIS